MRFLSVVATLAICSPVFGQFEYVSRDARVLAEINRGYRTLDSNDVFWDDHRIERTSSDAEWNEAVTVSTPADHIVGVGLAATAWQTAALTPSTIHATGGFRDISFTESPWIVRGMLVSSLDVTFEVTRPTIARLESELHFGAERYTAQWYPDSGRLFYTLRGEGISFDGWPAVVGPNPQSADLMLPPGSYTLSILADNDLHSGTATAWPDAMFDVRIEAMPVPEPSACLVSIAAVVLVLWRRRRRRRSHIDYYSARRLDL